jgi:hypothetical protein
MAGTSDRYILFEARKFLNGDIMENLTYRIYVRSSKV